MLNKILCVILLGFFAGLAPVEAQPTPAAVAKVKGRIIAARVQGNVNAISKVDGQTRVLHDGDQVSEQTEIATSPGASVILVFSNGATVDVAADSTMDIDEFQQDPFASDQKVSDMKAEPGTSVTRVSLTKGELVGKVVHLNVDKGSEFVVQTPVGAAGIRGTSFRIRFRPAPNGKAFFVLTTTDGLVVFRGTTSGDVNVPAGRQIVATFDYTPPSQGNPARTGQGSNVTILTSNTSDDDKSQIQGILQDINSVLTNFFIQSLGAGGNTTTSGRGDHDNDNKFFQPVNPTTVSPSS